MAGSNRRIPVTHDPVKGAREHHALIVFASTVDEALVLPTMTTDSQSSPPDFRALTGRLQQSPAQLLHDEVLGPQFTYELRHLLRSYVQIEKVHLLEYARMALLDRAAVVAISAALDDVSADTLTADPAHNLSDIVFAIERHVERRLATPAPAWHVDRSRNDVQACAQIMAYRPHVLQLLDALVELGGTLQQQAGRLVAVPMPGYTHYQAAQIISPGFYLAAVSEQILISAQRLLYAYATLNACPLGAGAMAGLELPWDRQRMAELLGFDRPQRHALVAVASRDWALQVASELSLLGVACSRFLTDLMLWGSSEYRFIDLPDAFVSISSAMPQKRNFTILERIRGKSAHLSSLAVDLILGQRNTPFSNLVEVSKESSALLPTLLATATSMLRLFHAVLQHLQFREERLREVCAKEYLGGFTLANHLTQRYGVPYRQAQVLVGRYITQAQERGCPPQQIDRAMLAQIARAAGIVIDQEDAALDQMFAVEYNLYAKQSAGSARPQHVQALLELQSTEYTRLAADVAARYDQLDAAERSVAALLSAICKPDDMHAVG